MKKLTLKKETIARLNKESLQEIKGGEIIKPGYDLWESRILCLTIKPTWDCGGSKSCQSIICIPLP